MVNTIHRRNSLNFDNMFRAISVKIIKSTNVSVFTIKAKDTSCRISFSNLLIKFYESPLGKKMASVRPEITKEGIVVAEQWVRYLEPLLIKAIEKSLEKEGYAIIKKEP